jgi:peptidoglycan/xylan/chitin deacetylase (PgdA/CDA1 family)
MMILSRDELHMLAAEGWGLSCHGMTHGVIDDETAQYEVVEAKAALEDASGLPVTVFCVPGSNANYPSALKVAAETGYDAVLTIYDDINRPDVDLMRLCRVPLHTEYPGPFFSAYDRFKRIHQAMEEGGWVIDYCHSPHPDAPIHPHKDCTTQELDRRFETVCELGGDDVWLAEPNEVVEYLLSTRAD